MVDLGVVYARAPVRHPVGDKFGHPRGVLDPDRYRVPETPHLLTLANRGASVGCHLQKPIVRSTFVIAEFPQNWRQFDRPLQRRKDLLHVEVALRWRQARFMLLEKLTRMTEARIRLLVVAPFDHAAFRGLRISGVAHIGGVALVAHKRPADFLPRAGELI